MAKPQIRSRQVNENVQFQQNSVAVLYFSVIWNRHTYPMNKNRDNPVGQLTVIKSLDLSHIFWVLVLYFNGTRNYFGELRFYCWMKISRELSSLMLFPEFKVLSSSRGACYEYGQWPLATHILVNKWSTLCDHTFWWKACQHNTVEATLESVADCSFAT